MTRMTDRELENHYETADETVEAPGVHLDAGQLAYLQEQLHMRGLRAVADAAERRVLDDLAEIIDGNLNIQRSTLVGFVVRKREELDRGDG